MMETYFSDIEIKIILFLAEKGPSKGAAVVRHIPEENETFVRNILTNLKRRKILKGTDDGFELSRPDYHLLAQQCLGMANNNSSQDLPQDPASH